MDPLKWRCGAKLIESASFYIFPKKRFLNSSQYAEMSDDSSGAILWPWKRCGINAAGFALIERGCMYALPACIVHRGAAGLLIANYIWCSNLSLWWSSHFGGKKNGPYPEEEEETRMHPLPLTYTSLLQDTYTQPSRGPEMSGQRGCGGGWLHSHNEPLFRSLLSNVNNGI